jgi:hypothetical protein
VEPDAWKMELDPSWWYLLPNALGSRGGYKPCCLDTARVSSGQRKICS